MKTFAAAAAFALLAPTILAQDDPVCDADINGDNAVDVRPNCESILYSNFEPLLRISLLLAANRVRCRHVTDLLRFARAIRHRLRPGSVHSTDPGIRHHGIVRTLGARHHFGILMQPAFRIGAIHT